MFGSKFLVSLLFFILLSALQSCRENQESSIDVLPEEGFTTVSVDLGKDIREGIELSARIDTIIILETTEDNLIGKIGKILEYKGDFYVFDVVRREIFVFNEHGKFKHSLGQKGKGPGEMLFPGDLYIDHHAESVVVADIQTGKTIWFDPQGEVVREVALSDQPIFYVNGISLRSGGNIFVLNHEWQSNKYGYVVRLDPESYRVAGSFLSPDTDLYGADMNPRFLSAGKEEAYLSLAYDNLIYKLSDSIVEPGYRIDFGDHELSPDERAMDRYQFIEVIRSGKKVSGVFQFQKPENDLLFFTFDKGSEKYHYFYSEERQAGLGSAQLRFGEYSIDIVGCDSDFHLLGYVEMMQEEAAGPTVRLDSGSSHSLLEEIRMVDLLRENPVLVRLRNLEGVVADGLLH